MRRILILGFSLALLATAALALSQAAQPSLGDVARQQRSEKKATPKHVITNEDLPSSSSGGVTVAASPTGGATPAKDSKDAKKPAAAAHADGDAKTPADETYRTEIQKQRAEITRLENEVADLQHKQQVQSTNAYMDAGARLRDPKAWTAQRDKLDKDIAAGQEKLQDARTKLDDLLEQARKLGISTSSLE